MLYCYKFHRRNRQKLEPKDVTVQLLRYDWFFYSEFKVMQLIVHENYKPASVEDDIALLRLDTDLDIGQESKYHSVCLPPAGTDTEIIYKISNTNLLKFLIVPRRKF